MRGLGCPLVSAPAEGWGVLLRGVSLRDSSLAGLY